MNDRSTPTPPRVAVAATVAGAAIAGALLVLIVTLVADRRAGDRFDLVRWERNAFPGKWLYAIGAPLRDDPGRDDAIARYFAAPPESAARGTLESAVEAALTGRVDAALRARGLVGAVPVPGSVFPPVNAELTAAPRVLVESPRSAIRRSGTALLRPDLASADAVEIERRTEAARPDRSALVVGSGGVATYPAIVSDRETYEDAVATTAHEWVHHYLAFYPLGMHYFDSRDAVVINETVADIVGDEIARDVIDRWGDPTRPRPAAPTASATPPGNGPAAGGRAASAVLRDLRREVDALLAAGRIAEAEARMEAERLRLWDAGYRVRRINQAYFAWYGDYAARPDAVDPLGAQLREVRTRAGSLEAFVEVVRGTTSRAEVAAALERLRGGGG